VAGERGQEHVGARGEHASPAGEQVLGTKRMAVALVALDETLLLKVCERAPQ
jgi:hypothetical protein